MNNNIYEEKVNGLTLINTLAYYYPSIISLQTYQIQITSGTGGQIQVFINGTDEGYFRGSKTFTVNNGDNISVWCDADAGYTFTNLCITGTTTCTTSRPFNFTANMNISMTATFTSGGGCISNGVYNCVPNTCNEVDNCGTTRSNPTKCCPTGISQCSTNADCTNGVCLSGQCIPKIYIYGGVAFFAMMMLTR